MKDRIIQSNSAVIIESPGVETLYGDMDFGATELFAGGFINFGYWENLKIDRKISVKKRALSSKNLYEKVLDCLKINEKDTILEVGCGLGNGCVLLHSQYHPKYVVGIDASDAQIQRAKKTHKKYLYESRDSIRFIVAKAENIPIPANSITKAFSVEALQHFESLDDSLASISKSLKTDGKFVVTTFFFKSNPTKEFFDLFPNFTSGTDKVIKRSDFLKKLKNHGFIDIQSWSIGKHVWDGFDKWISQTAYKETWDRNWIQAYKDGILDYYIFEARKK